MSTHLDINTDRELSTDMDLSRCKYCGQFTANDIICNRCKPDTCYKCSASDITITQPEPWKYQVRCSHGCSYPLWDALNHELFTTLLNGTPTEKLRNAGNRIEYIIPNGTDVIVHEEIPSTTLDDHVLGVHYSEEWETILEEGVKYPPNVPDDFTSAGYYADTIRENALYAWPHTPEYTEQNFTWISEYLIFEMPKSDIGVSSYRFLDMVSPEDDTPVTTIPVEHYEDLVFTPGQLFEVVNTYNLPVRSEYILSA